MIVKHFCWGCCGFFCLGVLMALLSPFSVPQGYTEMPPLFAIGLWLMIVSLLAMLCVLGWHLLFKAISYRHKSQ
ncbi:hypothetical protein [Dongshaea marina]|uniref:hypothetical protein n=1 Tax=Dongshaea marina TaxID=2047966 RepID=UPI000D3E0CBE|nr:hypothetical protein [Dongshaea marina]